MYDLLLVNVILELDHHFLAQQIEHWNSTRSMWFFYVNSQTKRAWSWESVKTCTCIYTIIYIIYCPWTLFIIILPAESSIGVTCRFCSTLPPLPKVLVSRFELNFPFHLLWPDRRSCRLSIAFVGEIRCLTRSNLPRNSCFPSSLSKLNSICYRTPCLARQLWSSRVEHAIFNFETCRWLAVVYNAS